MGSNKKVKEVKFKVKGFVVFMLLLTIAFINSTKAQTWNEFFRQNKTQQEYLIRQIAALKVYSGYLKEGYDLASNGINTINDIKTGEFNLHQTFIKSLKTVNPVIRKYARVAEIFGLTLSIQKSFNGINGNPYLMKSHQDYIGAVRGKVLNECMKGLNDLLLVIRSGQVEMTDDERIKRLDQLYSTMRDKSAFTQAFTEKVSLLILQKSKESREIRTSEKIHGITY